MKPPGGSAIKTLEGDDFELNTSILRSSLFGAVSSDGVEHPVSHTLKSRGMDAFFDQVLADTLGALFGESQVFSLCPCVVSVSFDTNDHPWEIL